MKCLVRIAWWSGTGYCAAGSRSGLKVCKVIGATIDIGRCEDVAVSVLRRDV